MRYTYALLYAPNFLPPFVSVRLHTNAPQRCAKLHDNGIDHRFRVDLHFIYRVQNPGRYILVGTCHLSVKRYA